METQNSNLFRREYYFQPFGFVFGRNSRFEIGNRKYRLGWRGVRILRLLAAIESHRPPTNSICWLLPFRGWFRVLERNQPRVFLTIVALHAKDHRMRCLAIWIRGRCGGNIGIRALSAFSGSEHRSLRKQLAQCLKKLGAWSELRNIEETEHDPQIRRIAMQSAPRPASARRTDFLKHVPRQTFSRSQPRLFVSPEVDWLQGKPAKPRSFIRAVLERIHRLVTGWKV